MDFEEQERGFAPATIVRVKRCLSEFLNWVAGERKTLRKLMPEDIARYVSRMSVERRWKRTTIVSVVSAICTSGYWNSILPMDEWCLEQ